MQHYSGHVRNRKPKNGKLTYQVIIESPPDKETGKRQRKYFTVHGTKKDAEKFMRDTIAALENQTYVAPNNYTVKSWLNEHYATYQEPYLSESTLSGYRYQLDNYIIPALGTTPLQNLSPMQVQQFVNDIYKKSPLSGEALSAKTVKNVFLNLSAAMNKAFELEMIKKNPCAHITLPKVAKTDVEIYSEEEIAKITKCAKGTDMEPIIMLALGLGLRRGEMIALRWEHVDFDNGVVHIKENRVKGRDNKMITKSPKSRAGTRDIPLSPSMIAILRKEKVNFFKKQLEYGVGKKKDDYVLCKSDGQPYKPFTIDNKWATFTKNNSIRHIKLHGLRHTNASLLLSKNVNPKQVQKQLGHSDYGTTMNIYAHVMQGMETEAAQKLEEALFKNVG